MRLVNRPSAVCQYLHSYVKNQHISKQKIFWIQKIPLEESLCMYEILRVLNMAVSCPNALLVCRPWYKGERFTQIGEATTSKRYDCNKLHCVEFYVVHIPPLCS